MRKIAIVGAGKIGSMIAEMLSSCGSYAVSVLDRDPVQLARLHVSGPIARTAVDIADASALTEALTGMFAVLNAGPFHLTTRIATASCEAGAHYLDLTEDVASTRTVRALADGAGTAFIPQCGLAPGFITIVAQRSDRAALRQRCTTCRMRVGALPQFPVQRARLQPDLEHRRGHQRILRTLRGDRRRTDLSQTMPMEELETFALDGVSVRSVQHLGRPRVAVRDPAQAGSATSTTAPSAIRDTRRS